MSSLSRRESKIQDRRKQTPRRDFVMEICSWMPLSLYKNGQFISRYPVSDRIGNLISSVDYNKFGGDFMDLGLSLGGDDFFTMFQTLQRSMFFTPVFSYGGSENSGYSDWTLGAKNSYLSFTVINDCENICYSFSVKENCTNIFNSLVVRNGCNNVFSSKLIVGSYNIFYSNNIQNCSDIFCSTNLIGCSDCLFCDGLENQSYCIKNKPYPKEEYLALKKELLKDKSVYEMAKTSISSIDIDNAQSCEYCFQLKDVKNCFIVGGALTNTNMYDTVNAGASSGGENSHFYGIIGGGNASEHIYCSSLFLQCSHIFYSIFLTNCSFCLGCIGLKNKSYCILNKQYSKEDWYEKVDEIFGQMDANGTLGDFFPVSMNPFYFNDTAAYMIDPSFSREEVTAKGYLRRDEPIKVDIPEDAEIIKSGDLANYEGHDDQGNRTINADILKCVIQDDQGNYYRIIPMEYKFLMKHGLPLPRKHWLERMKENFRIN